MSIFCLVERLTCPASPISPDSRSPRPVSIRVFRLTLQIISKIQQQTGVHAYILSTINTWYTRYLVHLQKSSEYQSSGGYQSFQLLVLSELARLSNFSPQVPMGVERTKSFQLYVPWGLAVHSHFSPQVPLGAGGTQLFSGLFTDQVKPHGSGRVGPADPTRPDPTRPAKF